MPTINGKACVVNGKPVDKVYSNGKQVYGRNLYVDTRNFDNPDAWFNYWNCNKTGDKFNGLTVITPINTWNGLGQVIQANKGEVYTFSFYARNKSGTGNSTMYFGSGTSWVINPSSLSFSLNETWQRFTGTFTVTADGPINARIEKTNSNANTLLLAGLKLERGATATPWTPAPEDVGAV